MDNLLNAILIKRLNEQDKKISDSFKDIKEVVETIVNKHYDSLDVDFSIEKILKEINERYNTTIDTLSQDIAKEFKEAIDEVKRSNQDTLDKSISDYISKSEKKISKLKPKDGKDYVITEKDYKKIAKLVEVNVPEYEIPKQPTPDEIRDMLELLQGDDRLDISAIKGFDEILEQIKKADKNIIVGGYRGVQEAPTDSKTYGRQNGEWVEITGSANADHLLFRVKNVSGSTIEAGLPVAYSGWNAGENAIEVVLGDYTQNVSIGILKQTIAQGEFGDVIGIGYLEGIDTSSYTEGTILYVGEGILVDTQPATNAQAIAFVLRSHSINGAIQISAQAPLDLRIITADQVTTSGSLGGSNVQEDLDILDGSIQSLVENKRDLYTWEYLVNNWSVEPTLNTTITGGEVYEYPLLGTTRYRFVPTTYDPTQDAFYANFDGTDLTELITKRG